MILANTEGEEAAKVDEEDDSQIIEAVSKAAETTVQNTSSSTTKQSTVPNNQQPLSIWPQFDELDKRMIKIALPCIANFAINPLIGAVDLFWVNRMGNALAVAGQAAANQVFSSAFWVISFLPSGELVYIVLYDGCIG